MRPHRASAALLTAGLLACASPGDPGRPAEGSPPASRDGGGAAGPAEGGLAPGEPAVLATGEVRAVAGHDLAVSFVAVESDSRCPQDVQCVWRGDAAARFGVSGGAAISAEVVLHTTLEPQSATVAEGLELALVGLEPWPTADAPIRGEEYRATVEVRPREAGSP